MTRIGEPGGAWRRWGWLAAAAVAAAAAAPGLVLPFLSDDWSLLERAAGGAPALAAYDYFRPLYTATFWLDLRAWGPSPSGFHLTNLLLLSACAALVVRVLMRYTGDAALATLAGVLFALHPWHVENAAWIAVRGDPLHAGLLLLAVLAYESWREREGGIALRRSPLPAVAAMAFFALALLSKESAVVLPCALLAVGWLDRSRRPGGREWALGLAPLFLLAAAHLFVLRPLALGGPGRTLTPGGVVSWARHLGGYAVAAVLPLDGELLASRPWLWGGVAAALLAGLGLWSARYRSLAAGAGIVFCVLLLPSMIGFQERYLYLPAAASGLVLAALVRGLPRRWGPPVLAALLLGWSAGCARLWGEWGEAARVSRGLVGALVEASRQPGVEEIVVANMPFRVAGGSVAGDFRAALGLSGGSPVPVRALCWLSFPARLSSPHVLRVHADPDRVEILLRIPPGPFGGYVGPGHPEEGDRREREGTIRFEPDGTLRLGLERSAGGAGRRQFVWTGESLRSIDELAPLSAIEAAGAAPEGRARR